MAARYASRVRPWRRSGAGDRLIRSREWQRSPIELPGQGGPAHATASLVFYIYESAFKFSQMGKASAIAWVLFAFILVCTLIQNRLQRRWVHYEAGET